MTLFTKLTKNNILLKIFVFLSLLFPMHYAQFDSAYYAEFSFANLFAGLFILLEIYHHQYSNEYHKFSLYMLAVLTCYILTAVYINFTHSRWLWETFNVTLAFLLFITLLLSENNHSFTNQNIIPFTINCQLLTSILAIIVYLIGYTAVSLINGKITLIPHDPNYYEKRFSWLYFHKSQYCFILLLFIGLFFAHRKYFKNRLSFLLCNLCCFICIALSHTYTALLAAFLILIGYFIDNSKSQIKNINKKYFLLTIPVLGICFFIINKMAAERNIWTLGGRVYIWSESIRQIMQNPFGIGTDFGPASFDVPGLSFKVYNCHNIFLNEMYRFSLPAGLLFTLLFVSVIVYSLKKHFSFLNLGIWGALLISMNMDYALLGRELSITVFYIYVIFFLPHRQKEDSKNLLSQ